MKFYVLSYLQFFIYLFFAVRFATANPTLSDTEANAVSFRILILVFPDNKILLSIKFPPISEKQVEETFLKKLNLKCSQRDNSSCIMLKLVTYMNRMLKKSSITLDDQVELIQTKYEYFFQKYKNTSHVYKFMLLY